MHPPLKPALSWALLLGLAFSAFAAIAADMQFDSDTRAHNLAHGRAVFSKHCLRCHEQGRQGTPELAKAAD